jgi:hypothetical protein
MNPPPRDDLDRDRDRYRYRYRYRRLAWLG